MIMKIPWAHFSQIKPLFSTWNIKSQNKGGFPFSLGLLHYVTPIKAMAQLYSSWCLYKNSRCLETDTDLLCRAEPYTPRVSRKSSPSPMHLCFYHHTHERALTLKKWSELQWKLWMLWLSLSYPAITSIYPVIYLKRPTTYRSHQADNKVRKSHIENRHTFLKVKINHWRRIREVTICLQIRKHFLLSKT